MRSLCASAGFGMIVLRKAARQRTMFYTLCERDTGEHRLQILFHLTNYKIQQRPSNRNSVFSEKGTVSVARRDRISKRHLTADAVEV